MKDVWGVISSVYQSNSTGLNTETFCLGVTSVRLPVGKGRGKNYNTFEEECAKRQGIITINNNKDNLCLPRSLVVAKAFVDKDPEYVKVRRNIGKVQTARAKHLLEESGVTIPEEGAGIGELQKFQQHFKDYKIFVYKYGSKGRDLIFSGGQAEKNLNLLYHEGHYNVITSLTAAFCCNYFCEECHVPHDHKNNHRCTKSCVACQTVPACESDQIKIYCAICKRSFRGQKCFENHSKNGICEKIRKCDKCFKIVLANRKHTCGEIFCKICKKHCPEGHLCYMQVDVKSPPSKDVLFVFYDLETRQEKQLEDGSFLHEPNLCVFRQFCDTCTEAETCQKCGIRLQILKYSDPIPSFVHHILTLRKKFKHVIILAHNNGGFDGQIVLNYILTKTHLKPDLIMRGTKLVSMTVENVKFLDSLNYFPMALSALPKAFGLTELKKGYFPHLFNTNENQNYVGPLPDAKYYSPDTMKPEARQSFLKWHEEHKNDIFDFQKEIVEYCVSDVEILTEACLKFREQMMSTTGVCPFTEACTIASACNKVFRRNFLKPNTIGIIPKGGYRLRDNQSRVALEWLIFEEQMREIRIQHAANGFEVKIAGVKVDGYCETTKQVFEFQGCYWHGCPSCFKFKRSEPLPDSPSETFDYRWESTVAKTDRVRGLGYDVIEKWECEFRKERKHAVVDNSLLSKLPLNPRDAFYGGRTGNCKTYYKAAEGENINYLDVCSLYPWVCKYGKFPVGHPEVIVGKECDQLNLQETDGLIKAKILPPQNLYHPVLPTKMNNKLMFILCRTCGEQMSKDECDHTDEERALTGTWVIDEVLKAIEKGYKILNISEVWKYQVKQYDIDSKTGGLFVEMMNKFIKIKQEASGWPSECESNEEKTLYIEAFLKREGIRLEFEAIVKNSGLRCLAKLMLNSFWGKLGQQENQPKTKIIDSPEELFNMLTNPTMNVNAIIPINDDVLIVNYEIKEECYVPLSTVNVCLAAYTTALARLKLYSYLDQLGNRALYYDTDSVIFVQKHGEFAPPTGDFIGDMTDELAEYGSGSSITEFVSGGPKNYAYKFYSTSDAKEKVVCKVKGISLNYDAAQLVNFETIQNMILKPESKPINIISKNIRRTKEHEVVTREEKKMYKPNSTKRNFFDDFSSVPYGFKRQKLN